MNKIKTYIIAHKVISTIVIVVVLGAGYWGYKKITSTTGDTRYITSKVERGNIVASVSGTGQVSSVSSIDLKPKVSGNIVYVGAKNGDKVSAGKTIAQIDTTDADKAVRDAQTSLDSTKLSLEKLKIQNSEENMNADLVKAYADGFSAVSDAFLDLLPTVNGLKGILDQSNLSSNAAGVVSKVAQTYRAKAETSYFAAKKAFDKNKKDYTALNTNSPRVDIENIIKETEATTTLVANAIKDTLSFVDYMAEHSNDSSTAFSSNQSTLSTYTSTIAGDMNALDSAETAISNNKDSSQNADLDLQSAQLSVTQKQNALQDAKDRLADYFIRAPYAGVITNMDISRGDDANSSTIVATLITQKQIAEVSMNEVDVAKIKVGEKATLTFDAVPDLTISGVVSEIDSVGTVSQGVVTYNVKITFDTQDDRVKPGMSVSAEIITAMKENVLVVPNSALKSQNGRSYVEMFETPPAAPTDGLIGSISKTPPTKIPVEIGLSNDSDTEIVSGLEEGQRIVTRTILPSSTTTAAAAPSIFGGGAARTTTGGTKTQAR